MTTQRPGSAATSTWRRWAAPFALGLVAVFATATIVRAALPAADTVVAEVRAPSGESPVPQIAAPAPTASPEPFVSPIEIVLPPPPPPPPPVAKTPKRGSSSQRSQAATSAGVTTTAAWCDGGYGATASASSVGGLLDAANAERARWGLSTLAWNGALASDAQAWSQAQAANNDLSHGMAPSPGGQNVAYRYSSGGQSQSGAATWAHSAWMASPSHCKNILNTRWNSMGAGAASVDGGNTWFLTVNFQ